MEVFASPVSPAQIPSDPSALLLLRRVSSTLHLMGAVAAVLYGGLGHTTADRTVYLAAATAFAALGVAVALLPPRRDLIGGSGFVAIAIISVVLTRPDPTIVVPLFYLWPLVAMAYFLPGRASVAAMAWMAVSLAPALLIGATVEQQVVYVGSLSTAGLMAGLVAVMRRDQDRLRDELQIASHTDPLTGLLNRRAFEPAFAAMVDPEDGTPSDVGIVLFDLDHFKRFNDTHGHLAGDDALRRVGAALRAEASGDELVCRLGGEEFAIAVPGGATRALALASGVACRLADEPIEAALRLTGSFGIAVASGARASARDDRAHQVVARADDALYAAKRAGRARAAFWTQGGIEVGEPFEPAELLWIVDDPARLPGEGVTHLASPRTADAGSVSFAAVRANRDHLIKNTVAAMFLAGAANSVAGSLMLNIPPNSQQWQWILAAVMLVSGVVTFALPGSLRVAKAATILGCVLAGAVVATCIPLISAPIFYVWPMVVGAYFCTPRFVAWSIPWAGLTLAVGLAISSSDLVKPLTFVGTITNVGMMAAVVSMLRFREAQLRRGLQQSAEIDPLTGLLNRRAFNPSVEALVAGSRADGVPCSVVLFDADHFKAFNDEHGHLAGDDALRRIAVELEQAAPAGTLVCRFGGEEFAVALPGCGVDQARAYADAVDLGLRASHQAGIAAGRDTALITVSAGIALAQGTSVEAALHEADRALYAAKSAGRARAAWVTGDGSDAITVGPSTEPSLVDLITAPDAHRGRATVRNAA